MEGRNEHHFVTHLYELVCSCYVLYSTCRHLSASNETSLDRDSSGESRDIVVAGLVSTASVFASIPASGASLADAVQAGQHDFRALDPCMERSGSGAYQPVLSSTQSANVGGIRGTISSKLGSSFSYRAVAPVRMLQGIADGITQRAQTLYISYVQSDSITCPFCSYM